MTLKQRKVINMIAIFIALWLITFYFHQIFDFDYGIIRAFIIGIGGAVWAYLYK